MTLQAVAKPPPGADAHTNLPVKTFEHSQCARCAEVAGSCRVASLYDPRAHEQRYVYAYSNYYSGVYNTNCYCVQSTTYQVLFILFMLLSAATHSRI